MLAILPLLLLPYPSAARSNQILDSPVPTLSLAFVPAIHVPDYNAEVLTPLKAAETKEAAERARLTKLETDCGATGGTLDGETCIAPPPVVAQATRPVVSSYTSNGNNYTFGQCTYYVASRVSVPSTMGNATNWEYGLLGAGWHYGLAAGSIGVSHVGYAGHVVIVDSVIAGVVVISEMNAVGWDVVDTRVAGANEFIWLHQ